MVAQKFSHDKISEPKQGAGNTLSALTNHANKEHGMAEKQPICGIPLPQVAGSQIRFALVPWNAAYAVGDDGSVWSRWKQASAGRGRPLPPYVSDRWRKLNPSTDRQGRQVVNLFDGVSRKQHKVHRLVLEAFVGPCPEGMMCCHNNGINSDNRLENLRWDTGTNNQADRLAHGTHNRGERCGTSKLTKLQVVEIVRRYNAGERAADIATEFGIHTLHVTRLARKERWPEVFGTDMAHAAGNEQPHVEVKIEVIS